VVELIEKYLAMTISVIVLVSLATPILGDGGRVVADCHRMLLVRILLDKIDFGVSETLRTGQPYRSMVMVPPRLSIREQGSRLILSFQVFSKTILVSREYPKSIELQAPYTEGEHLLHISNRSDSLIVSFWLI